METVKKVLANDHFCKNTVGIELLDLKPGWAKARLEIFERHLNGLGTVQGGAIFTLADLTLAAAANSHGTAAVLINASISYFIAVSDGILFAEAVEESRNPKLATYSVKITNQENNLIAQMLATVYRKKQALDAMA